MLPHLSAECNLNCTQPTDVFCNVLKYKALHKICVGNVTCLLHSADRRCNINAIYLHVLLYIYIRCRKCHVERSRDVLYINVYRSLEFCVMSKFLKIAKWVLIVSVILVLAVIIDNCIDNQPTPLILKLLIPMACIGYYILWKAEGNN